MSGEVKVIETVKIRRCFFPLGPPAVLLSFAVTLTGIVLMDLIVYRICLVSLNINTTHCLMLRTNSGTPEMVDLEAKVEPYASSIVMANSLIETLLPAVLTLFLGPWSDRNGRRPLLLAALTDSLLAGLALLSAFGGAIAKSLACKSWHMYLSAGRIFSFTELLGTSSSLGGSPLYTLILSHYLPPIYPSPVYIFSSCIYALLILCIVRMNMLIKKTTTYIPASQDDDQ